MLEISFYKESAWKTCPPKQNQEKSGYFLVLHSGYTNYFQFGQMAREKILDRKEETKYCSLSLQSLL